MTESQTSAIETTPPRRRRRVIGGTAASAALVAAMLTAGSLPAQAACEESGQWLFSPETRSAETLVAAGPTQSNYNGTGTTASTTFSAQATATVEASVSGSVNVGLDAKLASMSTTYGTSFSASLSAGLGNDITIDIPPGQTGNGDYGVYTVTVTGTETLYGPSCEAVESRTSTVTSPVRVGWTTWIS